ncbi:hypothetical protein C9426_07140 [Serratia sp. S1B]|nr:hypothetical protein C9426_07140 [Serratia sp. S1B]
MKVALGSVIKLDSKLNKGLNTNKKLKSKKDQMHWKKSSKCKKKNEVIKYDIYEKFLYQF